MTACKIKTIMMTVIRKVFNDSIEKPSTISLVSSGMVRPTRVVIRLPIRPTASAGFGIFVERMREKKGLSVFFCSFP